jgi:5-(carboxyamino)imidazole ribonucleotide synthase
MLNLIGILPDLRSVLAMANTHLHLYGKAPRPNRKLGHITLRAASPQARAAELARLREIAGQ